MKEYVPAIAAVIAGIFAVASAFMAWRLKNSSDDRRDYVGRLKEKREEEKTLYTSTFQLFEEAISEVLTRSEFTLAQKFRENNAKIHLLAPQHIIDQYAEASSCLESWSVLYAKASPKQIKRGDETFTILKAPDPTAKYKELAEAEYDKFQESLQKLVASMRSELAIYG